MIGKYKTRKRLAEAKLESSRQNLARVFDILEEVGRQANSLKRQASQSQTLRRAALRNDGRICGRLFPAGSRCWSAMAMAKLALDLNQAQTAFQTLSALAEEKRSGPHCRCRKPAT